MNRDLLNKSYSPADVEQRWYAYWEQEKLFAADANTTKTPYSIVIPPPNVTGVLHMGHALNNTMQDIMCRYRRLKGDSVLWMPGTDHAGIATQNVVEKKLAAEGTNRHQLGREKIHRSGLEVAQGIWQCHHQPAQASGCLVRLGPGALHHGRGTLPGGEESVRPTL
jgi:valyl-tRNA synthetase